MMIRRIREYGKREPSRDAHKIYVVCEGEGTEPGYFAFFEGLSSNLQVITIPPREGTDPLKLMALARSVFCCEGRQYTVEYLHGDTVWFVIDTDSWEREGKISPLRDFCEEQNRRMVQECDEVRSYSAWNVAQSNPCFEIWLYYHIFDGRPEEDEVDRYPTFKVFVDSSIRGGFDNEKDPIRLEEAILRAEKNSVWDGNGKLGLYSTEMYRLGREIDGFVKDEIAKL